MAKLGPLRRGEGSTQICTSTEPLPDPTDTPGPNTHADPNQLAAQLGQLFPPRCPEWNSGSTSLRPAPFLLPGTDGTARRQDGDAELARKVERRKQQGVIQTRITFPFTP